MNTLRMGQAHPNVLRWQQLLHQADLLQTTPDGIFGPATRAATLRFQQQHGLHPDGIVGPRTWAAAQITPRPGFRPLLTNTQRHAIFGSFEFVSQPLPGNPENIAILGTWQRENIVQVTLPQLIGVPGAPRDGRVWFHKHGAEQLQSLWQSWQEAGLLHLVQTWGGSFVPRFVRGSRKTLSNHSFGTAFDINMAHNGLGKIPAPPGTLGSVQELVPLAHQHGFYWGGHFSRPDGMHFELAVIL